MVYVVLNSIRWDGRIRGWMDELCEKKNALAVSYYVWWLKCPPLWNFPLGASSRNNCKMSFIKQTSWTEAFSVFKVILALLLLSYTFSVFLFPVLGSHFGWVVSFLLWLRWSGPGLVEFSRGGNTGKSSPCAARRLQVTSSMAAEVLCLLYKEHCVISTPPDPTTSSADCLGGGAKSIRGREEEKQST